MASHIVIQDLEERFMKIHANYSGETSSEYESDEGKSDFDDEYYKYEPPSEFVDDSVVVCEPFQPVQHKRQNKPIKPLTELKVTKKKHRQKRPQDVVNSGKATKAAHANRSTNEIKSVSPNDLSTSCTKSSRKNMHNFLPTSKPQTFVAENPKLLPSKTTKHKTFVNNTNSGLHTNSSDNALMPQISKKTLRAALFRQSKSGQLQPVTVTKDLLFSDVVQNPSNAINGKLKTTQPSTSDLSRPTAYEDNMNNLIMLINQGATMNSN